MKKKILKLFYLSLVFSCISCTTSSPKKDVDPFSYEGNFENAELNIDGKMDEEQWQSSEYVTPEYSFRYKSEVDGEYYDYSIKVYRGEKELFVFFNVEDCNLVTYGDDNGINVTYSDSCEVYINTELDNAIHPQSDDYQFNLGVHNRTRVAVGSGNAWSTSNGVIQYEVITDGTVNDETDVDKGYTLEMCISYKQLGINREDDIGMTFGIVDRFGSKGSVTSKKWYGANIKGHFGNPQNPSQYFILKKNSLELPPVDEYVSSSDTTEYIDHHDLVIPSATYNGQEHDEISLKVSRIDNVVKVLASTEENWQSHNGLFILFDFGDYSRTVRDENTYCLRLYPGSKSIKDFYKYPNIGVNQTSLVIQMSDNCVYISLDISKLLGEFEGNVNIGATSIEANNQAIVSQLKVDDRPIDQTNISTYFQLTKENTIVEYVDPFEYISTDDKTAYSPYVNISTPKVSNNGDNFGSIVYKINRTNDVITIQSTSDIKWHENELLVIYFDLGEFGRTTLDSKTIVLRYYPLTGSIKDFFSYPNTGLDKSVVQIYKSKTQTQVTINFSTIISEVNDYVEDGIGINFAIAHRDASKILKYATVNTFEQNTNLTTWPSINKDNSINKIYNPNAYSKDNDNTVYNTEKTIKIPESSSSSNIFDEMNISVSRSGYKVTILVENKENDFSADQMLLVQFDLGLKSRTQRDENTFILRCYPINGEIKDFFRYPSSTYNSNWVKIKTDNRYIQITIDFSIIAQDVASYVDEGIGLSIANCEKSTAKVLKYCTVDDSALGADPSKWIRLDKNGNYVN